MDKKEQDERVAAIRDASLVNLGMLGVEAGAAVLTGNSALIAGVLHESTDTVAHASKYAVEKKGWNQNSKWFKRFLRGSMGVLAVVATWNMVDNTQDFLDDDKRVHLDITDGAIHLGTALVMVAGNTFAHERLKSLKQQSSASQSSLDHAKFDMVASYGYAGSLVLEVVGVPGASLAGGAVFSGYTAVEASRHAVKPHLH